jgi:hypothetical protein
MLEAKVQRQVDGKNSDSGRCMCKDFGLDQLKAVPGDQSVRVGLVSGFRILAPANGCEP